MRAMRRCPQCHMSYQDGFQHCPHDGARLEPEATTDPLLGTLLNNTYRVNRRLGGGGMGNVYLAVNERIGKEFAVKILHRQFHENSAAVARFFREARAAAQLDHRGIVQVVDCDTTPEGAPFMVMERLIGEDLNRILKREGALSIERSLDLVAQAADALEAVHRKRIVHRDIKPHNIFVLQPRPDQEEVKLLDFGIALLRDDYAHLTLKEEVAGTPAFIAPEQIRSEELTNRLDPRTDIYSLGVTLFTCVCGRKPFLAESATAMMVHHLVEVPPLPRTLRADIPLALQSLILWMLAKDPSDRPQTVAEVSAELRNVLENPDRIILPLPARTPDPRPDPGAEHVVEEIRLITVMVADIEPDEEIGIERQVEATTKAYEVLSREIRRHGGHVEQMLGNRVIGLFGLELSFGDEPVRAVQAAIAARGKIGSGARARVAIGTGRILVPSDSVSIGPAASAASHLLRRADFEQIAVDATTYSRIRSVFRCRPLSETEGSEAACEIEQSIEQVGLRTPIGPFGRDAATVGRRDEMDQLWDALEMTMERRQPTLVAISGEPGLGKSRLKSDFVLSLDSESHQDLSVYYLEGAAQTLAEEVPFSGLGDVICRRAQIEADCPQPQAVSRLRSLVTSVGIETEPETVVELLAIAAGVSGPQSPPIATLPPKRLWERIIDAFVRLILAMARRQPVVLCLEDAHHGDRATLDTLEALGRKAQGHAVLILVVGRPSMWEKLDDMSPPSGGLIRLTLEPLSRSETRSLLAELLNSEPPRRLQDGVWKRAEGVPLFIEAILFALRLEGALVHDSESGEWRLTHETKLVQMPPTIEGVALAQLDTLPFDLKDTVRRAAVIGNMFWDHAIAALGVEDHEQKISTLVQRGVFVTRKMSMLTKYREYEFVSKILRDVAYKTIPQQEREGLHSRAAHWLLDRGATPALPAFHLERAGKDLAAASQYVKAGDTASKKYANREALHHYDATVGLTGERLDRPGDRTLEAVQTRIRALFGSAEVLARLGEHDQALAMLDSILKLAEEHGDERDAVDAMTRQGALVRLKDPLKAAELLERTLELARTGGVLSIECKVLGHLAMTATFSGSLGRGSDYAAEAVAVARRLGDQDLLLKSLIIQGTADAIRGGPLQGLSPFDEAAGIARQMGNLEQEAELLYRIGFILSELGDQEGAERNLMIAREYCERTGNQRVFAYTLHNLGWVLWRRGLKTKARQVEIKALELSQEAGLSHVELATEIYLSLFDLGEGNEAAALTRAKRAYSKAIKSNQAEPQVHAAMAAALAFLALGHEQEAVETSIGGVAALEKLGGTQQFEVELHLVAALCLSAAGREAEAEDMRQRATAVLRKRTAPIKNPDELRRLLDSIGHGLPREVKGLAKTL